MPGVVAVVLGLSSLARLPGSAAAGLAGSVRSHLGPVLGRLVLGILMPFSGAKVSLRVTGRPIKTIPP